MARELFTISFDPLAWTLSGIWKITDYLSTVKNKPRIDSNVCECEPGKDLKWKLALYLGGDKAEKKGYMSLYLWPVDCNKDRIVEYSLSLLKDDNVLTKHMVGNVTFKSPRIQGHGFRNFISKDLLEKELISTGSSSALTVKCTIKYVIVENLFSAAKQLELSSVDMRSMLKDWKEDPMADVTFKIKQTELTAHKFILASSSNVFRTMFYGNYQEKCKDVVVEDVDYDVMVALFDYIYTREIESNEVKFALNLATAADKYDIGRLYTICVSIALENLAEDNVVDVMHFTRFHDCNDLKQKGIQLLKDKFKDLKNFATLLKYDDILKDIFETI